VTRVGGPEPAHAVARARELVLAHGWNTTAYQILAPGVERWFAPAHDAVVGFVRAGRTRVVAGAPIAAVDDLATVAAAFERDAAANGERVCYFAAEERFASLPRARPYARLCLGAQPVWSPHALCAELATHASLRAQLHRARNKGVHVEPWEPGRAAGDAALRACLCEWLATRRLPPLHFLVEPAPLDAAGDRRLFVAQRGGTPVAFLVATPIPARDGWLVEQIVRGQAACNGVSELLVGHAARAAAVSGARLLTLGLAPLGAMPSGANGDAPWRVRAALAWLRAHGRRFYDFRGLEAWKGKFRPDRWEPVFALAPAACIGLGTLAVVARAFTQRPLAAFAVRAFGRALAAEARAVAAGVRARRRERVRHGG
jgi:phosphatidylglycerol lysyltransferase